MKAGKLLLIGSEDVEVWPNYCGDGHRCIQCYFTGKYFCAPRWRHPIKSPYGYWPPSPILHDALVHRRLVSINANLNPKDSADDWNPWDIAQPLVPINDGGCVEEMTERLIDREAHPRVTLVRETDKPCPYCGYEYSTIEGASYKGVGEVTPYWIYRCPQCHRQWTDNPDRVGTVRTAMQEFPKYIKDFAIKRRHEGVLPQAIVQEIDELYHMKVTRCTVKMWTKWIWASNQAKSHHAIKELHRTQPSLSGERISKILGVDHGAVYKCIKEENALGVAQ